MNYTEIVLPYRMKRVVLALGAQSKSAICFAKDNSAWVSDSGGELSDLGNFKKFEKQIKLLQKKFKIKPDVIACDLHPEYVSTRYALRMANDDRRESRAKSRGERRPKGIPGEVEGRTTKIQHHEAHVASCAADNNIKGRVIGVAFDGTGFGRDGNIWGGEFFVGSVKEFKRAAHLKYIPMPGGEACIKEPWRMAFSYLYGIHRGNLKLLRRFLQLRLGQAVSCSDMLGQMIDKKINAPLVSSMGRLFDGVSALIGICSFARYEGEAAIRLEKIIEGTRNSILPGCMASRREGKYSFKYKNENDIVLIDWEPVIRGIVKDLKNNVKQPEISLKFHNAICDMVKDTCNLLRKKYKINKVCFSGGVFQNKYLSRNMKPMLEKEGFNIYVHKNIPTHDGGIALGQAVLAGA